MKTETQINENILKITMTIRYEFPELLKFLNEMTITIPDVKNPEISIKILEDYFNSLRELLIKYAPNHDSLINHF